MKKVKLFKAGQKNIKTSYPAKQNFGRENIKLKKNINSKSIEGMVVKPH